MKNLSFRLGTSLFLLTTITSLHAAPAYWDIDGATAGAGGATPAGAWTNTFWSTSADGDIATGLWTADDTAVFSAGTDATGAYTVTLGANQSASGVTIEEGTVTLTNNTLTLTGAAGISIATGATLNLNS